MNRILLSIFYFFVLVNASLASVTSVGTTNSGVGIEPGKVKKLLCVGDSITWGVGGDGDGDTNNDWGYRKVLQDQLGIGAYDFVGTNSTPASDATYDVEHYGNSGQIVQWIVSHSSPSVWSMKSELNAVFGNARAGSVVLLHAATNDVILQSIDAPSKRTNAEIIANFMTIIDNITSINNQADIYVALIVPLRQVAQATWWGPFNDDLKAALLAKMATTPRLHIVDMYNAFMLNYTGDCPDWYNDCMNVFSGAHPSATGYLAMAKMWARCMADNTAVGCDGN